MRATALPASAFAQRLDDRDAAGDRGLEVQRDACASRPAAPARRRAGQQRLVGGDHRLAGLERGLDRGAAPDRRRRRSARRTRRCRDRARARPDRRPSAASCRSTPRFFAARARADTPTTSIGRPQRAASACALLLDQAHHRGADRAETGETDFEGRSHERPHVERRRSAPRGERNDVVQFFRRRFQGTGGCCGRPAGCAARSRPARCAHSPRRARRSRRRATPRPRPSRPAAWRTRRCRASRNGSGIGAQANIEAAGGGTSQPARPKLSTSTSRRRL